MSVACGPGATTELTSTRPYADAIGKEYRTISDVDAVGIYRSVSDKTLAYIKLMPPPGIGGSEVAFSRPIEKGTTFRVRSAWKTFMVFDDGSYYVVDLEGNDLPPGIEVRVALLNQNKGGSEGTLTPRIYERLP